MLRRGEEDERQLMSPGESAKNFLRGLVKFVALVLVAGGVGVALGMGLSGLSDDDEPTATQAGAGATTDATTTRSAAPESAARIRVSVLGARLFTDSTPSARQEQRARVTVRIRVDNSATKRETVAPPILRVGSVRIPTDAMGEQFAPLEPGASQTVTLRFALAGEATPKVVRDRRARILIAGQSLPIRVKVQPPVT